MVKLTIIVPIYNIENYIEKCLGSLIKIKEKDIEIILVNDGSTDNSYKIIKKYEKQDSRIKVINQKNKGLSGARNEGIKRSTGEFIWFVDGDDYISNIHSIFPLLNDDNDIIIFNYNKIVSDNIIKKNGFYNYSNKDIKYILAFPSAWNKIFRRSILDDKFFPIGHIYEDIYSIPSLILKTNKIVFFDNYLYNYVDRFNSIKNTSNKTEDRIYAMENNYNKLNNLYKDEVEYLYIENLIISSLIEEITNKCKHDIKKINKYVKNKYPKYYKNKYIKEKSLFKRLYILMIYFNFVMGARLITRIYCFFKNISL